MSIGCMYMTRRLTGVFATAPETKGEATGKARASPKARSIPRARRVFLNETIMMNVLSVESRRNFEELRLM
jgi:hypothetical protein